MDDNEEIPAFLSRTHAFVTFPSSHRGPCPQVEESVENFWKEALQFEENFNPREFWDVLHVHWVCLPSPIITPGV
ncbi:MAG: hypothetical protein PHQ81_03200 [Methanofollis sp.]|nr:hypothetical protein [Methanofollis sp.]